MAPDVVVASSHQQRVDRALRSLNGSAEGFVVDVSDEARVRGFFERVGAFDHLVYTAGETLQLERLEAVQLTRARDFFNTDSGVRSLPQSMAPPASGRADQSP